MSEKRNSWTRRILSKINKRIAKSPLTKAGKEIGKPFKFMFKGVKKSINTDKKMGSMMRGAGLTSSTMGSETYDDVAKRVRDFIKSGDISSASNLVQEQKNKMNK